MYQVNDYISNAVLRLPWSCLNSDINYNSDIICIYIYIYIYIYSILFMLHHILKNKSNTYI